MYKHPGNTVIRKLMTGELDPVIARDLIRHVAACESCGKARAKQLVLLEMLDSRAATPGSFFRKPEAASRN